MSLYPIQTASPGAVQDEKRGVTNGVPASASTSAETGLAVRPRLLTFSLHAGVILLFTLLTIVATWPLFPNLGGYVMDKGDPLYSVWAVAWQDHALATNPLGLFDANIMYPFRGTLTFDELGFTEAIMAAPFYYLLGNPVLAHNIVLFASFILSGYAVWLLVRELSGSNRAGLVSGVAFAFCFFRLNHLPHITLDSVEFMPVVLLSAYKLMWTRRWAWAAALGGLFAAQSLAGHYLAFYTAMLLGLFVVYYGFAQRRYFSPGFLLKMGAGLAGALLLILPIAGPYISDQSQFDFRRDIFESERFSNTLSSFLAVFRGNPVYRSLLAPFADSGPWSIERAAFPGFVVLLLAVVGIALLARRSPPAENAHEARKGSLRLHAGYYGIVAVFSALLSLGPSLQITYAASNYDPNAIQRVIPLPYGLLQEWVPGFDSMRVVARLDVLTQLALAVLAGFGALLLLNALSTRAAGHPIATRLMPVIAGILVLLPVAESWSAPVQMEAVGTRSAVPPEYRWLAQQPHTVILEYPMVHWKHGDPSVEMANLYQYYTTYHWHDTINASTTIKPFAYSALVWETERCFPCPRSLAALHALGVKYVVAHLDNLSGPQRTDFEWRAKAPEARVLDDFSLVKDFGSTRVYEVQGPHDAETIASLLPPGASLLLGDLEHDPKRQGTDRIAGGYMAALGWHLHAHPEYGNPRLSLGQKILPFDPQHRPDFALLWAGQPPDQWGYHVRAKVWSNEQVVLYKAKP